MALFFISYDLLKPGKDYQKLIDKLESMGAKRVLLSMWALRGNYTAVGLRDMIKPYMDTNDRLLVDQSETWAASNAMTKINDL